MIVYSRWNCEQSSTLNAHPRGEPDDVTWTTDQHRRWDDSRRMTRYRFWDEWLNRRLDLFETYTYPSMLAQTDQDFTWLGLVHEKSPEWFISAVRKFDRMEVRLVDYDIEAAVRGEISINLDTDDALSRNFVEEAKKVEVGETTYVHGLKYRTYSDFWFETHDEIAGSVYNVINHPDVTVLDHLHGRSELVKHFIGTPDPRWLQVIHGQNIANGLRPNEQPGGETKLEYVKRYFELGVS